MRRAPGAMVAAMLDDRITAGLIPDAVHSHPATVRLAVRAKGPDRIAVVSDMISSAGLGPEASRPRRTSTTLLTMSRRRSAAAMTPSATW